MQKYTKKIASHYSSSKNYDETQKRILLVLFNKSPQFRQ